MQISRFTFYVSRSTLYVLRFTFYANYRLGVDYQNRACGHQNPRRVHVWVISETPHFIKRSRYALASSHLGVFALRKAVAATGALWVYNCRDTNRQPRDRRREWPHPLTPVPGAAPAGSPFLARLRRPGVIIGDGAMGTMLYSAACPPTPASTNATSAASPGHRHPRSLYGGRAPRSSRPTPTAPTASSWAPTTWATRSAHQRPRGQAGPARPRNRRHARVYCRLGRAAGPCRCSRWGASSLPEARDIFREQIDGLL